MLRASFLEWVRAGFTTGRTRRSGCAKGSAVPKRRRSSPVLLEVLEDRTAPAVITVTSLADVVHYQTNVTVSQALAGTDLAPGNTNKTITLRDAINAANNTGGSNTIVLPLDKNDMPQKFNLTQIDNYWYGPDGLPAISSDITIQGNGATIARSGGPNFRFFYVSNGAQQYGGLHPGSLTLQGLTLQDGMAKGGDSGYGGGGLGAGGAIFNQGTLVLDGVLLKDNTAKGGNTGGYTSNGSYFGGGIGQAAPSDNPGGFGSVPAGSFPNGVLTREGQGGSTTPLAAGFGGGGNANGFPGGFGGGGGSHMGTGGFGGGDGGGYKYGAGGAGMGGAIFNRGGTVTIINSTLTGNQAQGGDSSSFYVSGAGSAFGGAIFNLNGSVVLTNDTIADNTVHNGHGVVDSNNGRQDGVQVYNLADSLDGKTATATLTLANTILAGAQSPENDLATQEVDGANTSNTGNTATVTATSPNIVVASFNFGQGTNGTSTLTLTGLVAATNANLGLEALANNGGWSQTMALQPDSPARNAGSVAIVTDQYDQRGPSYQRSPITGAQVASPDYLRIQEGSVDLGAIEMQHLTLLDRLGYYDPTTGLFSSLQTAYSITSTTPTGAARNVYVIAHGWANPYLGWVNEAWEQGRLPLSWETFQGEFPAHPDPVPYLHEAGYTEDPMFQVNSTGLAQEILLADPNATVLAFSWIDESATDGLTKGYQSEAHTTMAGMQLAEALMEALAPDYHDGLGKVHLIGHSHGARVATVAALALQQAALNTNNPNAAQYDVVRQLTLLDSPEDNGYFAPVNHDDANFDWFNLAQLNMPGRTPVSGMVQNGKTDVTLTGTNIENVHVGDGVTGPGVPAGTTVLSLDPIQGTQRHAVLSLPVSVPSGTATINLGFWDWSNDAIFVDSYKSYFGSEYGNFDGIFTVQGGNKQINQKLGNVVDVILNTDKVFKDGSYSPKHQYSATWYAGSASPPIKGLQVGLLWSPLITGSPLPPEKATQSWTTVDREHQFDLTAQLHGQTRTPIFDQVKLTEYTKYRQGGVTVTPTQGPVTAVTLNDQNASLSNFDGYFDKAYPEAPGFSFDYSFTGGTDGAKLEILMNGSLYFVMDASTAVGLPGSGQFSATFGLGAEYYPLNPKINITIRLVRPQDSSGSTTVTVSNFHQFTLGSGSAKSKQVAPVVSVHGSDDGG